MHQAGFSACGPLVSDPSQRREETNGKDCLQDYGVGLFARWCLWVCGANTAGRSFPRHHTISSTLFPELIALYFGFAGSLPAQEGPVLFLEIVYLALGILGLTLGIR